MERSQPQNQEPYQDEPSTPSEELPQPFETSQLSQLSACNESDSLPPTPTTTKPLPPLPHLQTTPPRPERYHEHPPACQTTYVPYTDNPPSAEPSPTAYHPYTDDNDSTPLAFLLPIDAPPSYNVAVRQSYRDTLISHIPSNSNVSEDTIRLWRDEESGPPRPELEMEHHSHTIERMVAYLVVGMSLLIIGVGVVWWILGSDFAVGPLGS